MAIERFGKRYTRRQQTHMSGFHHFLHQTEDPPFRETGKKPLSNKGLKKPTLHQSYLAQTPEEIFTGRFPKRRMAIYGYHRFGYQYLQVIQWHFSAIYHLLMILL
ncbi:hypothetical protein BDB01DRAFT_835408 [Pilobolus umbonatus]|nr:hypothetical protein BDB01DRAFT_835408 [Pilobolus umbonatus]